MMFLRTIFYFSSSFFCIVEINYYLCNRIIYYQAEMKKVIGLTCIFAAMIFLCAVLVSCDEKISKGEVELPPMPDVPGGGGGGGGGDVDKIDYFGVLPVKTLPLTVRVSANYGETAGMNLVAIVDFLDSEQVTSEMLSQYSKIYTDPSFLFHTDADWLKFNIMRKESNVLWMLFWADANNTGEERRTTVELYNANAENPTKLSTTIVQNAEDKIEYASSLSPLGGDYTVNTNFYCGVSPLAFFSLNPTTAQREESLLVCGTHQLIAQPNSDDAREAKFVVKAFDKNGTTKTIKQCSASQNVAFTLSPDAVIVDEEATAAISVTNNTSYPIHWESENTSIATVNGEGVVTGVSEGNTNIIAFVTDGTNRAERLIPVTVNYVDHTLDKVEVDCGIYYGSPALWITNKLPETVSFKVNVTGDTTKSGTLTIQSGRIGNLNLPIGRGTYTISFEVTFDYHGKNYSIAETRTVVI